MDGRVDPPTSLGHEHPPIIRRDRERLSFQTDFHSEVRELLPGALRERGHQIRVAASDTNLEHAGREVAVFAETEEVLKTDYQQDPRNSEDGVRCTLTWRVFVRQVPYSRTMVSQMRSGCRSRDRRRYMEKLSRYNEIGRAHV